MKPYHIFTDNVIKLEFDLIKNNVRIYLDNTSTNIDYDKFKKEINDLVKHLERVDKIK